jgi:hypothetical protein
MQGEAGEVEKVWEICGMGGGQGRGDAEALLSH